MTQINIKLEETLNRLYKENQISIDAFSELIDFADPDKALQLQQTGVVCNNLIDESPEPRINVHRFNENDYHDGKFLK